MIIANGLVGTGSRLPVPTVRMALLFGRATAVFRNFVAELPVVMSTMFPFAFGELATQGPGLEPLDEVIMMMFVLMVPSEVIVDGLAVALQEEFSDTPTMLTLPPIV